jgi:hypothetical protein
MPIKTRTNSAYTYRYAPIPIAQRFHQAIYGGLYAIFLLVCGARSGKTKATIGGQLLADAFWQPGYYERDIRDGEPYSILATEPTFKMVKLIAWRLVLRGLDPSRVISINETDRIIEYQGVYGITQIIFASYEQGAQKIEGIALYRAYLDECFQCPKPFYDEVLVRLSDRMGRLVMVGTPKPVAWIQEELIDKANKPGADIFYMSWWTKHNPYFPKSRLEMQRRLLAPKIFRRNYEACLEAFQGQIYEEFDRDIHVQDFEIDISKYKYIWGSKDWGWTHNGALYIFGLRDDDFVDVLHEHSAPQTPIVPIPGNRSWFEIMQEYQQMYADKFDFFYAGPDQPESIDSISTLGVRIRAADNPVIAGIQFVSTLMHPYVGPNGKMQAKLRIHKKNCPILAKKLPMYRWAENSDGTFQEKPLKKDDDECDSLRYGLFSMREWFRLYSYIIKSPEGVNESNISED